MQSEIEHSPPQQFAVYRRWWIILASVIGLSFSTGTTLIYTFGIFAKPLAAELKTGLASIALPMSVLDLGIALTAGPWGRAVDRYGARRVIVLALLCLSACLVGLASMRPPLWHLYVAYLLAGVTTAATTSMSYSRVVSDWFDRERGFALAIANCGLGLGAFITPVLAQWVIDRAGWRFAYLTLAASCLLIALPVVVVFLRDNSETCNLARSTPEVVRPEKPPLGHSSGLTLRQALRTKAFWQLGLILFWVGVGINGASAHLVPVLTHGGVSPRSAALAASSFGGAMIVGRLLSGWLVDRYFAPLIATTLFGAAGLGIAVLWTSSAGMAVFLAAVLLGIGAGAEGDLMPFLVSRYFGMRAMAELYGLLLGAFTIGNAGGRYLLAAGFDAYGSYNVPLLLSASAVALAVIVSLMLGPYQTTMHHQKLIR